MAKTDKSKQAKESKRLRNVLGIDVGGSGIKGGIVDTGTGELLTERHRFQTPKPATPQAVAGTASKLVDHFSWDGTVGVAIPTIVQHGVVLSAANIDKSWMGVDAVQLFSDTLARPVTVLNDADAAGYAEMVFGAGSGISAPGVDVVILLTFGTGIGSAIFVEGVLLPNTELGHLELRGDDAEHWASAKVREDEKLSWKGWGKRVGAYLAHLEFLFSPDAFIIGGGVSKHSDEFLKYVETRAPVMTAQMENRAGVIGAAWYAAEGGKHE